MCVIISHRTGVHMIEFFKNAIDTIRDDRFSWRFKLCNIIMNDRLRLNTAFARIRIIDAHESLKRSNDYARIPHFYMVDIMLTKAKTDIEEIWHD